MLGALAAALLLAGVLPWVTGGEATIRFLALPLLIAGLLVLGATLRVHAAGRTPVPSAPPVERGCDGCACGVEGGCAAAGTSQSPAAGTSQSPAAGTSQSPAG
jgi:hypothetical protein